MVQHGLLVSAAAPPLGEISRRRPRPVHPRHRASPTMSHHGSRQIDRHGAAALFKHGIGLSTPMRAPGRSDERHPTIPVPPMIAAPPAADNGCALNNALV